jgi:pectinesterase
MGSVYLGRPWRDYARVVYVNCQMGDHIRPEGWDNWRNPAREKTAFFAEFGSQGRGASPEKRVAWARTLTSQDFILFETKHFLGTALKKEMGGFLSK